MILIGDAIERLKELPDESVQCVITSPPYFGLRDYGHKKQIGLEKTPEEYVSRLTSVFQEMRRVLRNDGTFFLNLGDSYAGSGKGQHKDGEHDQKKRKTDGMKLRPEQSGLPSKNLIGITIVISFQYIHKNRIQCQC